ncbi:hypothetical protein D9M70_405780 [compost metagenome]
MAFAVGAHAHESAGLQHAQQLDLQLGRHLGDFVEEQGAAVGAFEVALVLAVGPGKAAALVAEHLALDQRGRDRAAIDREERLAAPRRQLVHGLRGQLLAGAAFADQQHRGLGGRHARELVIDRLHHLRTAHQPAKAAIAAQFAAQRMDFGAQLAGGGQALEHGLQPCHVDRLDQVVGRAGAQRVDRAFDAGIAGGQDHFDAGGTDLVEQLHAVAVGQAQVGDDRVRHVPAELQPGFAQAAGGSGSETFHGDDFRQRGTCVLIVIDNQDVGHTIRQ